MNEKLNNCSSLQDIVQWFNEQLRPVGISPLNLSDRFSLNFSIFSSDSILKIDESDTNLDLLKEDIEKLILIRLEIENHCQNQMRQFNSMDSFDKQMIDILMQTKRQVLQYVDQQLLIRHELEESMHAQLLKRNKTMDTKDNFSFDPEAMVTVDNQIHFSSQRGTEVEEATQNRDPLMASLEMQSQAKSIQQRERALTQEAKSPHTLVSEIMQSAANQLPAAPQFDALIGLATQEQSQMDEVLGCFIESFRDQVSAFNKYLEAELQNYQNADPAQLGKLNLVHDKLADICKNKNQAS